MKKFLGDIQRKCKSTRGETLTEVLAASVVSGLAILLLAVAISAAANMNINSARVMDEYYAADKSFVEASGGTGGSVSLNYNGDPLSFDAGNQVVFTINEESAIVAYEKAQS